MRPFAKTTLAVLLLSGVAAMASDYRLDTGATVEGSTLKVAPRVEGPAGAALRYEIRTVREGAAGRSKSSQSGNVTLGRDGTASLATTNVSVTPQDHYEVSVKLLQGSRVIAEKTVRYPR